MLAVASLILCVASIASSEDITSNSFYFEYLDLEKEKNGLATQKFELHSGGISFDSLVVYYRAGNDKIYYQAKIYDNIVTISSEKSSYFTLYALGKNKKGLYIAKTSFCLFGNSQEIPEKHPAVLPDEVMPDIELISPKFNYWPQTGQHFKFKLVTEFMPETEKGFAIKELKFVVKENQRVIELAPDVNMVFSYVPAHDKELRQKGVSGTRQDIVFVHDETDNAFYQITYTILLHRSRTAFLSKKTGAAVLTGSLLLFLTWIILKRKRKTAQW